MRTKATPSPACPADITPPGGVLVLRGYGLSVRVWRGRLRVADGIGRDRRELLVHRATGRLRRLVVLGHTGSVSLEAVRWLADVGAGYLQIDEGGRVLAAFGPRGSDRPSLRRAQARALDTPVGNDVARRLVADKIAGQAETLVAVDGVVQVPDVTVASLRLAADALHVAVGRDMIRSAEAAAASAYWSAWSAVPIRFARRDADRVPAHWRTFGGRASPLTGNPRLAGNPANAILNYLYALLEGEAAIAARIVGLDPGLGVLHADLDNRDSLATDLMEPVRPLVDRWVLTFLADRALAAADIYETRQGVCRLMPTIAAELTETIPLWRKLVGRVAEDVASLLTDPARPAAPTPITGRCRANARPQGARTRRARSGLASIPRRCSTCGALTDGQRRACSEECAAVAKADQAANLASAGAATLGALREVGFHRELSADGRRRIGSRATELLRAAQAWRRANPWPDDMGDFAREILPGLADVPPATIAYATGLSNGYVRRVKAGEVTPHPMWWEMLRQISGT
jgi:CRISPR-associated endonuclease Cas1